MSTWTLPSKGLKIRRIVIADWATEWGTGIERGGRNGTSFKQTKSAGAIRRRAKECEGLAGGDGAPGARSPVMGAGGGKLIIPGPPKLRLGPSL